MNISMTSHQLQDKLRQFRKFIATLVECLPEMDFRAMQRWIQNPKILSDALKSALLPTSDREVWKTITVGGKITTPSEFCISISDRGRRMFASTADVIRKRQFCTSDRPRNVKLVQVAAKDLGLDEDAKLDKIYEAAFFQGLNILTIEEALQLSRQWQDQPKDNSTTIAMEVLMDGDGSEVVFVLNHNDKGMTLDKKYYGHGHKGSTFIFAIA